MIEELRKFIQNRYDENQEWGAIDESHEDDVILKELERIEREERDKIARNAASVWCRCFKCDGIVNDTNLKCEKPCSTCTKWYDAYKGALIAME